jgi:hypothetical protein
MRNSTESEGNILKEGIPFIHNFGFENTCVGLGAGNLTMRGWHRCRLPLLEAMGAPEPIHFDTLPPLKNSPRRTSRLAHALRRERIVPWNAEEIT